MSNHGGKRENANRPCGQGKFGKPTTTVRIPQSQTAIIKNFLEALQYKRAGGECDTSTIDMSDFFIPEISAQPTQLPLFSTKVAAGFPNQLMIMARKASMLVSF